MIVRNAWASMCALAGVVLLLVSGCSERSAVTNSAPPTVICGTTLNNSAAGAVVDDATADSPTITSISPGGIFIQVSHDCQHGAEVTWTPTDAATLAGQALADDGLVAAVVFNPKNLKAAFTVTARRAGAVVAKATVALVS